MELEFKFKNEPCFGKKVLCASLKEFDKELVLSELESIQMKSKYYYDDHNIMKSAGITLRIREENSKWIFNIKEKIYSKEAEFKRYEIEFELALGEVEQIVDNNDVMEIDELEKIYDYHLASLLSNNNVALDHEKYSEYNRLSRDFKSLISSIRINNAKISIAATCNFVRDRILITNKSFCIELAFDKGVLGRDVLLDEIEFEIKSGDILSATEFINDFAKKLSLIPEEKSKFERSSV